MPTQAWAMDHLPTHIGMLPTSVCPANTHRLSLSASTFTVINSRLLPDV